MNEVYFIGGPFDLTKRMLDRLPGDGIVRMYQPEAAPDFPFPPHGATAVSIIHEYRLRQIPPGPTGNRRYVAVVV
jgi:hypothetical protein